MNRVKNIKGVILYSDHLPVKVEPEELEKYGKIISFNYSYHIATEKNPNKLLATSEYFAARKLTENFTNMKKPHMEFVREISKYNLGILCFQESVEDRTKKLIEEMNGNLGRDMGLLHNMSGFEGIATIYDKTKYDLRLDDVLPGDPVKKHHCLGIEGRALQACVLYNKLTKNNILVINLHAPNPATKNRITINNGGNAYTESKNKLQVKLNDLFNNIFNNAKTRLKDIEQLGTINNIIICGDFNDSYHINKEKNLSKIPPIHKIGFKINNLPTLKLNKPPITCCAYARNKVTRLPGDYIFTTIPNKGLVAIGAPKEGLPEISKNNTVSSEFKNVKGKFKNGQFWYNNRLNLSFLESTASSVQPNR